jgi:crossover junction endodeoxyribonuclease RusA
MIDHPELFAQATPPPTDANSACAMALKLPWPLSLNRIWRAVGGKVLLSFEARAYGRKVSNALPKGLVAPPIEGRLAVSILLCPPKNQNGRWDVANREKLICDALTKNKVWVDDSQIDWICLARGPAYAGGRAFVRIDVYHPGVVTCPCS